MAGSPHVQEGGMGVSSIAPLRRQFAEFRNSRSRAVFGRV